MLTESKYFLIGIVEASKTKARGCGGLITILTIKPDKKFSKSSNKKLEINLPGRHRIDIGERLKIGYDIHSSVYWGASYDILDKKGNVLYSDVVNITD